MAFTGREPSPGAIHRNPIVEFTEIPDTPNLEGRTRTLSGDWHAKTLDWWAMIREMPHTRLWSESDWAFASDTAHLKEAFYTGTASKSELTEMRIREDNLGVTMEARRKLRIRYVKPRKIEEHTVAVTATWDVPDDG